MAHLLDTNVCISLINSSSQGSSSSRVRARFAEAVRSGEEVWIPSISVYELWYGVAKSAQKQANLLRLQKFLEGPARLLEFDGEDARQAGEIRNRLEQIGRPIGAYDVLIAGQALHRKLTLVTSNTREFARVTGLLWQDWSV